MREVAIVGVGCTGFKSITPDASYKELMFEAAVRAYEDAARAIVDESKLLRILV